MHKNVVLSLEDKHVVERAADSQRHSIRERALVQTDRQGIQLLQQPLVQSMQDKDPRPHSKSIRLSSHSRPACKQRHR